MAHKSHSSKNKTGKMTAKVTTKSKCSGGTNKSTLKKGASVTIDKVCSSNSKYHIKGKGWVNKSSVKLDQTKEEILKSATKKQTKSTNKSAKKSIKASVKRLTKSSLGKTAQVETMYTTDMTGIWGIPYSFMDRTDLRYSSKVTLGRKYVEKIMSKIPVLLITPGLPNFAPDMSKKSRLNLVKSLLGAAAGKKTDLAGLLKKENQRYYSLDFKWTAYYKYVNAMCRYCAIALGIGGVKHPRGSKKGGEKFKSFNWQYARNQRLKNVITTRQYVAFYIDAETSVSESMTNSTTYSQLKDAVQSVSDVAKELQFLAGPIVGTKVAALGSDEKTAWDDKVESITDSISKHLGYTRFVKNAAEGIKTVATGGTVVYPKIWQDSEFNRTYDVSIKLRSPDADLISIYLNIIVPLIHLIALTAPRNNDANSFKSPFLIRAYYKGIFNVDMGIISSLSITKGREGAWTVDGLPSEVDIQLSIEEMYESMSISNTTTKKLTFKMFKNVALIDYLSNMCGININEPDTARILAIYSAFYQNKLKDLFVNGWGNLTDSISSYIDNKYQNSPFRV